MISEKIGTILKKNTKNKIWWMKLGVALVLSNVFFFILFKSDAKVPITQIPQGWVEIQLNANLLTPFQEGKRILLVHRGGRQKIEGIFKSSAMDRMTVLVKEEEAHALLQYETWEILPFLKYLNFAAVKKETSHEIRY